MVRYRQDSKAFRQEMGEGAASGTTTYYMQPGTVIQGGADACRPYYSTALSKPDHSSSIVVVNCARRSGQPKEHPLGDSGNSIIWLPMTEANKAAACRQYLEAYGPRLLAHLRAGGTVVVNCQEGLHRSVELTRQLLALARAAHPWLARPDGGTPTSAAPEAAASAAPEAADGANGAGAEAATRGLVGGGTQHARHYQLVRWAVVVGIAVAILAYQLPSWLHYLGGIYSRAHASVI